MLLNSEKKLYELADITICPAVISTIESRSECEVAEKCITDHDEWSSNYIPLITSPMSSVVSLNNYRTFEKNGVSSIIPRNIPINERIALCSSIFCAFSLSEVEEYFINTQEDFSGRYVYILIDIANGHMLKQLEIGKALRDRYGDSLMLMGGNIANPETVLEYVTAGFDYVRLGIAGGSRCLTGTQTGIYYPMASLISETVEILSDHSVRDQIKIIADGGIGSYSDIIKCLALGADYVMLGRLFAETFEGGSGMIYDVTLNFPDKVYHGDWDPDLNLERDYYGMSTKKAQLEISGKATKTSEGKIGRVKIKSTLPGWIDNFKSYLRSSMSYCGANTLLEFSHMARCYVISEAASYGINSK